MPRFEFSPASTAPPNAVDWDEFLRLFDERGLELIYDDEPGSRLHKFAYPETVAAKSTPKASSHRAPRRAA